ncbi:Uncharacterised protein [Serratia fonticola]|nr:Uncharacterised protein [Serratia fonticola]
MFVSFSIKVFRKNIFNNNTVRSSSHIFTVSNFVSVFVKVFVENFMYLSDLNSSKS